MLASTEEALARHTAELKTHHERLRVLEVAMRQRAGRVSQAVAEHTVHGATAFYCPCEEYRHAGPISVQPRREGLPDPMPHWVCEHCSVTITPWRSE